MKKIFYFWVTSSLSPPVYVPVKMKNGFICDSVHWTVFTWPKLYWSLRQTCMSDIVQPLSLAHVKLTLTHTAILCWRTTCVADTWTEYKVVVRSNYSNPIISERLCVTINRCFIVLCLRVTKDCGEIYCDCFVTDCTTWCSRIHHTASFVQLLSNIWRPHFKRLQEMLYTHV